MLLKRLKQNSSANLVFIPIAAVLLWLKSLFLPFVYDFFPDETSSLLYAPVHTWVNAYPLVGVVLSLLLIIALGFLMQMINAQYLFIRIRSKFPGILYVLVVGGFVFLHTLHPVYFAAVFFLFAVYRLFSTFEKKKPYSALIDTGFLLGVGSLFYYHLVFIFPAFLLGVLILTRETRWRELVITALGFLLPFLFAFSYVFFTNQLNEHVAIFKSQILFPISKISANYALWFYLAVLVLYTVIASIDILTQYDSKKISSRKFFSVYFWIFTCSLLAFVVVPGASLEMLLISSIPVTFLISNLFIFMKRRFWSELLFMLLLGIIIIMQYAQSIFHA